MKTRDVATIAFRLLAAWITLSALTGLIDLLANWKMVAAQVMGTFSNVSNAPTRGELLWMSATAMVGRAVIGVIAWWLSPLLARITCPLDEAIAVPAGRRDLYAAASFLVGLWLVAGSAPGLAFEAYVATKPGFPAYPEAHEQVPLLLAQCVLGILFIRGHWLIRWALSAPESVASDEAEGAVQQRDEADEAREG